MHMPLYQHLHQPQFLHQRPLLWQRLQRPVRQKVPQVMLHQPPTRRRHMWSVMHHPRSQQRSPSLLAAPRSPVLVQERLRPPLRTPLSLLQTL
jgi:hypothetical protein